MTDEAFGRSWALGGPHQRGARPGGGADEIAAIKACVARHFGECATVRLFGSRVHDHLRGGDIDLHVEADSAEVVTRGYGGIIVRRCDRLWQTLQDRLGERKIDIVDTVKGADLRTIDRAAYVEGVPL